jgi:release factor glutamine methyltransferase
VSDERSAAVRRLAAAGVDNPRFDARILWNAANGDTARFAAFVARREKREPVAYIIGEKEFWSLAFEVGPGVLIPRPETETLVEAVLNAFPDRGAPLAILDLGTGSGCILAALLSEYPAAGGTAIDVSEPARRIAGRNLQRLGFATRSRIIAGDWCSAAGKFDVVVSNPPYIRIDEIAALAPEIAAHEPVGALDGGADGLDAYRALAPLLAGLLAADGLALLEIGRGQGGGVKQLLTGHGLDFVNARVDLAGIERVLLFRIGPASAEKP